MQFMNPLTLEDLDALNDLGKLPWGWEVHYWPERELKHGCFYIKFINPRTHTQYRVDGCTVVETANKAINNINNMFLLDIPIPDYP